MTKLTCLYNADGETVGYFSDHVAAQAARAEWDAWYLRRQVPSPEWIGTAGATPKCRSVETYIKSAELEGVEPGDGDRVVYWRPGSFDMGCVSGEQITRWLRCGASFVEVSRFLINRYRRPGESSRDTDLGGPVDAAGVLYVLTIKAPK